MWSCLECGRPRGAVGGERSGPQETLPVFKEFIFAMMYLFWNISIQGKRVRLLFVAGQKPCRYICIFLSIWV